MLNKQARKVLKRLRRNFSGAGSKLQGRRQYLNCPIHYERTASFTVNLDTGVCHCFGCGYNEHINAFALKFAHRLASDGREKMLREFALGGGKIEDELPF